ncbi:hypothetical protein [Alkalibacterium sp. 20]|uniref:hypothetical protein n=1 Tax=Alkalibacterium sp. 20 TaxID=1798803 RepID=UPI0009002894|nr:hypothetical protein [Alkalibacterium sp. 20]OJF94715.1 hypothetical protein AX762_07115 [Alkalibacterium sp. 20]
MDSVFNNFNVNKNNYWFETALLSLLVTSMIISDWLIGPFAVSELVMGGLLALTLLVDPTLLKKLKLRWLGFISLYMLFHIGVNYFINTPFNLRLGVYSYIKVVFFFVFVSIMYEYIKRNRMEAKVLRGLNIGAIIAIIIGVYITLSIATDFEWPYEFFWRFTRTSSFTYEFKGNSDIIRTRSLFSEPAHLGYFLNSVLGINFFGKLKDKYSMYFQFSLIIGILLTLSYASIGVMVILIITKLVQVIKENKDNKLLQNKTALLILVVSTLLIVFIFRDFLYTTIIERTIGIIEGTDNSAYNRLISSWTYISRDYILFGNGIAHSPPIQNVYAYFLTDLGMIGFVSILFATYKLLMLNFGLGFLFILLNFQKGGYLSPIFSLLILIIIVFANYKESKALNN